MAVAATGREVWTLRATVHLGDTGYIDEGVDEGLPGALAMDVRWRQRLESFDRALALLAEPLGRAPSDLSMLGKEGPVQRFVYVWELSWKTVRDYLEAKGTSVQPVTPRSVLKEAFAAGILPDGAVWMAMVDHRDLLSHAYSEAAFEEAFEAIRTRYHRAIQDLNNWLHAQEGSP